MGTEKGLKKNLPDVFISYSNEDKAIADTICSTIETKNIKCWIAPRDILPGQAYAKSIVTAITGSRIIVLVFSSNSNKSPHIEREVEIAFNKGKTVIPFRIENAVPSDSLEYFLAGRQWLDALTPPLARHTEVLTDTLARLLRSMNYDEIPRTIENGIPNSSAFVDKNEDVSDYSIYRIAGSSYIEIGVGDITLQATEAIVSSTNSRFLGASGVDAAILKAGGAKIINECRRIGRCETGSAVITTGGNLKAKYVIHAVGPRYIDGKSGEAAYLASVYGEVLNIASERKIRTISFPSISTGVKGYPIYEASEIALSVVIDYIQNHTEIDLVRFVLFSKKDRLVYEDRIDECLKVYT